ncbi:hypothetical protein BD626DRAFT_505659 [Schizophyllum amplum]|uniref:SET domain-containing protein n=1 Tax=Schizophyllum amplum TaxID=97359 RepID=A0A550C5R5_9AGAR|nr:hypothetical protein BD626DRAFT_505659 [Auriculariopsis ampla]
MAPRAPPSNWPASLRYTEAYVYHSSVDTAARGFIRGTTTTSSSHAEEPSRHWVAIRRISEAGHPAAGQYGLFATKKIPAKTRILYYIGEVHADERNESDYDLCLHRFSSGVSIGIDASRTGNEARFVNDYRGVRPKPNAVFTDERVASSGELRIAIWSGTDGIKKGEEILVSYGKGWWTARTQTGGDEEL